MCHINSYHNFSRLRRFANTFSTGSKPLLKNLLLSNIIFALLVQVIGTIINFTSSHNGYILYQMTKFGVVVPETGSRDNKIHVQNLQMLHKGILFNKKIIIHSSTYLNKKFAPFQSVFLTKISANLATLV